MTEEPIPPTPPGPPEPINQKALWATVLAPIAVMVVMLLIAILLQDEGFIWTSLILGGMAILVGWVFFANLIGKRFRGSSMILMVLAYPLAEIAICFTLFFFGCLASISVMNKPGPSSAPIPQTEVPQAQPHNDGRPIPKDLQGRGRNPEPAGEAIPVPNP